MSSLDESASSSEYISANNVSEDAAHGDDQNPIPESLIDDQGEEDKNLVTTSEVPAGRMMGEIQSTSEDVKPITKPKSESLNDEDKKNLPTTSESVPLTPSFGSYTGELPLEVFPDLETSSDDKVEDKNLPATTTSEITRCGYKVTAGARKKSPSISWAEELYDPIPAILTHTRKNRVQEQSGSRKKKKANKKQK